MSTTIKIEKSGAITGTTGSNRFLYFNTKNKTATYYFSGVHKVEAGALGLELLSDIDFCLMESDDLFQVKTTEMSGYVETSLFGYEGAETNILVNNPNDEDIAIEILAMACEE